VITPYIDYARSITQYWTPRDDQPEWGRFEGWYLPVFFGLTPEVGLYLREQTGGLAAAHVLSRETGDGLRWWYLTRGGIHAEDGESSFTAPQAAWSHFLAHAYILGERQETLRRYLDRPWGRGDLYSIQKIVATIQAPPEQPDFSTSAKVPSALLPRTGDVLTYTILIRNTGRLLTETVYMTDTVPAGLTYVPGSLTATLGIPDASAAPVLRWRGVLSPTRAVTVTYRITVTAPAGVGRFISNTATIAAPPLVSLTRTATVIVNGYAVYLPVVMRNSR
ncbi:MAG: DUF11 domain-containing protein, partial [Anaerolineae bacterium]|nr:DUF11 domain-containing protein [Anaerolineae bacterium]